jgi:tetratricopeptide (TPR) repeat protein
MKSLKFFQVISVFCVLAIFVGCGSKLQQADKMAMSDPKTAIASYEEVIKTKPGTDEAKQAQIKMADAYYKMSEMQKALQIYDQVAKENPKTKFAGEAETAIGMHYYSSKEYEKSLEEFKKVGEEVPDTDLANDATLWIGKSYEMLDKNEDAVKTYLDFAKAHSTHRLAPQAALTAAKVYETKLDKPDEAIETYKFVATKFALSSSAREAREKLTNMGVDASEIPTGEAQVQAQSPQPQTTSQPAARAKRRAVNVPRPDIGSTPKTTTTSTTGTGTSQATQPTAESRTVSSDFGVDPIDLLPDISADQQGTMYDAIYMIGITYLQSGQYKESGALFEKSLQLVGNKPWNNAASAYLFLGKSYKGIGKPEKAAEMFKEAIKKDSKIIDRMITEGETQYGEEEYDKALESYKTILGLVPYRDADIYYDMGLVYKKLNQPEKELEAFEHAVALKPNNTDAIQSLAEVLYYRMNNSVRATLYDTEARGQGNNDYKVQMEIGDLCYKYGSYSWASTKYNSGIRIITQKINNDLKKAIGTGEEAKKISEDPTKIDLKLVSVAATSGNLLAIDALKNIEPMIPDLRFIIARRALSQIKNKQIKDAKLILDQAKVDDPGIENTAEYQCAVGELELAQGNKDIGVTAIKKALELNPNHLEAAAKLKELGL